MSIATVVTGGFGSFGSVNLLPTIGYSIGAVAAPVGPLCFRAIIVQPRSVLRAVQPAATMAIKQPNGVTQVEGC